MKLVYAVGIVGLIAAMSGCASVPVVPKKEWRRTPASSQQTVFPGIDLGMIEQQVRNQIPKTYTILDNQGNILRQTPALQGILDKQGPSTRFLRVDRLHEAERVFEIDHFVFVNGKLKFAFGGYSSPLH